jgi:UDP-glucose 4-epimerase
VTALEVGVLDAYRGLKVVVTGGAGFIGSHLTDTCIQHGANVTVIDDLSCGDRNNVNPARD